MACSSVDYLTKNANILTEEKTDGILVNERVPVIFFKISWESLSTVSKNPGLSRPRVGGTLIAG